MNRSLRYGLFLTALALACFAFLPAARAVCQDACLAGSNTVQGDDALISLTTGIFDTANGAFALESNTTGNNNTAIGVAALSENSDGANNTAVGLQALVFNTTGSFNTAIGVNALYSSVFNGSFNTASGANALFSNAEGFDNVANGFQALLFNTTGNNNTAIGVSALINNTTGNSNIALGSSAGSALTTGKNNIDIGNAGSSSGESAKIRIGTTGVQKATFVAGISGVTVPAGVGVIVGTDGKLGTVVSSERFKDAVKPMDKASEAILALKPVTFHYKHEFDPDGIQQFGLVAEEVEKVNPDLVACDDEGKPYTVRYEAVNAMLLNEFLKEHRKGQEQDRKIGEQGSMIAQQQKQIEALTAMVKEQAVQIQKVNAELQLSRPALQAVVGNR